MRKAGNAVEISLILGIVAVVTIGTLLLYNNQSIRLAALSAIHVSPVNLTTMDAVTAKKTVPYNRVETAGSNALITLGMTSSEFESALTNNVTYEDLTAKDSNNKNIIDYAKDLGYNIPTDKITDSTLSDLVKILNKVTASDFKPANDNEAKAAAGFIERFGYILKAANVNAAPNSGAPDTAGANAYSPSKTPDNNTNTPPINNPTNPTGNNGTGGIGGSGGTGQTGGSGGSAGNVGTGDSPSGPDVPDGWGDPLDPGGTIK